MSYVCSIIEGWISSVFFTVGRKKTGQDWGPEILFAFFSSFCNILLTINQLIMKITVRLNHDWLKTVSCHANTILYCKYSIYSIPVVWVTVGRKCSKTLFPFNSLWL